MISKTAFRPGFLRGRRIRLIATCACLLGASWLQAVAALACSPVQPGLQGRGTTPPDGAVGAPTNAQVLVWYSGNAGFLAQSPDAAAPVPLGTDLVLIDSRNGAEVPANVTKLPLFQYGSHLFRITPQSPLESHTRYQIADRRGKVPCDAGEVCGEGARTVFSTFTTSAVADSQPPTFAGEVQAATKRDTCGSDGCCGPYDATLLTLEWPAASDDHQHLVYAVYANGALVTYLAGPGITFNLCFEGRPAPFYGAIAPGTIQIGAVDLGGNSSSPREVVVPASWCARVDDKIDGGARDGASAADGDTTSADADADAGRDAGTGAGCACSTGAPPDGGTGAWQFVLLMLAITGVRRRECLRRFTVRRRGPRVRRCRREQCRGACRDERACGLWRGRM